MKLQLRDNRGAALVELALTTPLFLLLTMGSLEIGRLAYFAIEVANAARAGASYGAVNISNAGSTSNVQQAAKNDAPDVSDLIVVSQGNACVCETMNTSTGSPSFSPSSGTTSCTSSTITSCTAESSTSVQSVIEYVTVSTQANVDPMIHVPGLPTAYTLNGYSAMRILQN
ncbi:MAG TPA: TadE/TadG family type IV pilus assembly protein [Terracidiphilus sp.]|nr:TadE/TadG family type IV pilus assembly protein [Terracidiphilus sp.]